MPEEAGAALEPEAEGAAAGAAPLPPGAVPPELSLGAGPAGGEPVAGPPAWRNVTVSSMSCIRSLAFLTAPSYSGLPVALSMNDWKTAFACW